jgi:hypothetical protein
MNQPLLDCRLERGAFVAVRGEEVCRLEAPCGAVAPLSTVLLLACCAVSLMLGLVFGRLKR